MKSQMYGSCTSKKNDPHFWRASWLWTLSLFFSIMVVSVQALQWWTRLQSPGRQSEKRELCKEGGCTYREEGKKVKSALHSSSPLLLSTHAFATRVTKTAVFWPQTCRVIFAKYRGSSIKYPIFKMSTLQKTTCCHVAMHSHKAQKGCARRILLLVFLTCCIRSTGSAPPALHYAQAGSLLLSCFMQRSINVPASRSKQVCGSLTERWMHV